MQIYVVKPGDTVEEIAMRYSVPPSILIESNQIENPDALVPGQTIVIPIWGSYYFVQPGDTIYSISKAKDIDVEQLIRINNIQKETKLMPGMRLYIPPKPRKPLQTGAYIDGDITGENSSQEVQDIGEFLTTLQVFSYEVNSEGELTPPPEELNTIDAAYNREIAPLMVLTNIEDGQFSQEAATAILNNEALQDQILDDVIKIMKEKGYKGLDIDFEYLGAENREKYNQFLVKARDKTSENAFTLSSALAPKISDDQVGILYEGHDYEFHGKVNDYVYLMTYEWGWTGGPPRAVAPINEVEKVIDYALTKIPKEKIMMGIPLYGYDWTLPYVEGESRARAISSQEAIDLAREYGVNIEYDEVAQSPYFNYVDEEGREHEVWFEDARSAQAKFDLVKSRNIGGLFYWVLGRDFPQNWLLLEDNFIPKKIF